MYKIFINEKPFIISSHDIDDIAYAKCKRLQYEPSQLLAQLKLCETMSSKGLVLITDDIELAFKDFYTHFVPIEAAGGLVHNTRDELLVIKRMGKWDLPKGKIDAGETIEQAATREVEEECGIKGLTLTHPMIAKTYHTYKLHNHRFLKITYWFKMRTDYDGKLSPQTEEHITEVKWIEPLQTLLPAFDTYSSIRQLLQDAYNK